LRTRVRRRAQVGKRIERWANEHGHFASERDGEFQDAVDRSPKNATAMIKRRMDSVFQGMTREFPAEVGVSPLVRDVAELEIRIFEFEADFSC
jgi:hypothetical protein